MSKLSFIWIDDQEEKITDYQHLLENETELIPGCTLQPIIVKDQRFEDLITTVDKSADLIIIDHIFTGAKNLTTGIKGSSLAHIYRDILPKVPMVCVTGALNERSKFDKEDFTEYTALFETNYFSKNIEQIFAIARDFPKIEIKLGLGKKLVKLLGVPKSEQAFFLRILPQEFNDQQYKTTQHRVAYWIFNTLMKKPGFLYDKLHTATFLGLNEKGFDKVSNLFSDALYKGPFNTESHPLWWASELEGLVISLSGDSFLTTTQEMGRSLKGIVEDDYSQCYFGEGKEDIPDVVVKLDNNGSAAAICSRHTINEPNGSVEPGFETVRIIPKNKNA